MVKKAVGTALKIVHAHSFESELMEFASVTEGNKDLENLIEKSKQELLDPVKVDDIFDRVRTEVR